MARAQQATAPGGARASRARNQSKRAGEPSAPTRRLLHDRHGRLELIPITLWDRPVSECVRTRSPTHSNGPIGDARRPMIESSREIRRESQKKLQDFLPFPKLHMKTLPRLPFATGAVPPRENARGGLSWATRTDSCNSTVFAIHAS